ncbi:carbohydrate ABC transporter permease [Phytoactinopolyspora alkaliphila]|uniref:Carbohydrate ABC transporter permease n=1 Tax=Phytoactinopolyspora alkaliphila TaxID=1783498 RepID=A0A6N9YG62_9ACTN|nr:carbohydrate ABC transporter permease [Phytoactinopolyspora alkaliphila]
MVLSVFPIIWAFIMATRDSQSAYQIPPPLLPGGEFSENVSRVIDAENGIFLKGMLNSAIVAGVITISVIFFSSLAGFAFAKLRFRGRNALMLFIVATMMVPTQLAIVPLYLIMMALDWTDSLQAVIVPFLVNGFGVFLMRQYAVAAVSDELIEAGRIDGCSTWRIYWHLVLPALRPACAVLGLLTFMLQWNEFIWPFVVLTPNNPTVQLSIKIISAAHYTTDYAMVFASTALAMLPLLVVFVVFGRQIISGIMEGSVKE